MIVNLIGTLGLKTSLATGTFLITNLFQTSIAGLDAQFDGALIDGTHFSSCWDGTTNAAMIHADSSHSSLTSQVAFTVNLKWEPDYQGQLPSGSADLSGGFPVDVTYTTYTSLYSSGTATVLDGNGGLITNTLQQSDSWTSQGSRTERVLIFLQDGEWGASPDLGLTTIAATGTATAKFKIEVTGVCFVPSDPLNLFTNRLKSRLLDHRSR